MSREGTSRDVTRVWGSMTAGGGGLVCVSGLGGEPGEWMNVGPALARHGDVIAVALTLDAPHAMHGGGGRLQVAVRALDRLLAGEPGRPVLVGHSMGALASLLVAATRSDRLAGLVLTAPFVPAARHGRSTVVT